MKTIFVTGGAGFIGSNFLIRQIKAGNIRIINYDKLTYAGNLDTLSSIKNNSNYLFIEGDICDQELVNKTLVENNVDSIINFAAESHVDRSIESPGEFIQTNIVGTFKLLQASRDYLNSIKGAKNKRDHYEKFRFLHVSTDEVYGSLGDRGAFTEQTPYAPNSPYAASKAASDHLIRSYYKTFNFPAITTNCSNNYGPHQFPEKLIPLMIQKALLGESLPVYGDGLHVRDWLYVDDHARALFDIFTRGRVGEKYNVGGNAEMENIEVVTEICDLVQELGGVLPRTPVRNLIAYVTDRPGHDQRYAMDASKIKQELGWKPRHDFHPGLRQTVEWYLSNEDWWRPILEGTYQGQRLGLEKN